MIPSSEPHPSVQAVYSSPCSLLAWILKQTGWIRHWYPTTIHSRYGYLRSSIIIIVRSTISRAVIDNTRMYVIPWRQDGVAPPWQALPRSIEGHTASNSTARRQRWSSKTQCAMQDPSLLPAINASRAIARFIVLRCGAPHDALHVPHVVRRISATDTNTHELLLLLLQTRCEAMSLGRIPPIPYPLPPGLEINR